MSNLKGTKPSTSEAEPTIKDIQCRNCSKNFKSNSILKHLSQSKKQNCISVYTVEEINNFKKISKELSEHKKKLWKEKNKEHEAEYQAEYNRKRYQENRDNIISQRRNDTKSRYKQKTIIEHGNDLNKYKERCKNFAIEENDEQFSHFQEYFTKKIEKLKWYIVPDRKEYVQNEFDSIEKLIKETYEELNDLINETVEKVKDENENWDTVAIAFSSIIDTYETMHLMVYERPEGKRIIKQKWEALKKKLENDMKRIQRDEVDFEKECKGCKKSYQTNTILTHLGKNSLCHEKYNESELGSLKEESQERNSFKKNIWREINRDKIVKQKAKYYKENILRNKAKNEAEENERLEKRRDNTFTFYKNCQQEKYKRYLDNEITYFELSILKRIKLLKSKSVKKENLEKLIQIEIDMKEKVTDSKRMIDEANREASNISCHHDAKDIYTFGGDHGCYECSKLIDKLYNFLKIDVHSARAKRSKIFETFFTEIFKSLNEIIEEENAPKEIIQIWDDKLQKWHLLVEFQWDFVDVLKNTERIQYPNAQELTENYYNYKTDDVELCFGGNSISISMLLS